MFITHPNTLTMLTLLAVKVSFRVVLDPVAEKAYMYLPPAALRARSLYVGHHSVLHWVYPIVSLPVSPRASELRNQKDRDRDPFAPQPFMLGYLTYEPN